MKELLPTTTEIRSDFCIYVCMFKVTIKKSFKSLNITSPFLSSNWLVIYKNDFIVPWNEVKPDRSS